MQDGIGGSTPTKSTQCNRSSKKRCRSKLAPLLVATLALTMVVMETRGQRKIPDDNLAYPVLITLQNGTTGSGFYLNATSAIYFVTAKHVLFHTSGPSADQLLAESADLLSYPKDPKDQNRISLHLDLKTLETANLIHPHKSSDVAIVKVFTITKREGAEFKVTTVPGVQMVSAAPSGLVGVGLDSVKKYDEVLIANDILVFGYPTSLGLKNIPQLDYSRPLLRTGIIAGKNDSLRSLILDCPIYPGNSGGPVLEIDDEGLQRHFKVVGIITQFVPVAEQWLNTTHGYTNTSIGNSGYAVAVPMDFVLDLIADFEKPSSTPTP